MNFGLRLQTDMWWGWLVLAFIVAGITVAWLYRRLYSLYAHKQAALMLALKLAAVGVLLLGLLRPALVRDEKDLANARVLLLVDDSRSMTTRDGSFGGTRLDDATKAAFETILPRLKKKLSVETLAFADAVRTVKGAQDLHGDGPSTDIAGAVRDAANNFAGSGRVGAFVLVTDGGDAGFVDAAFTPGAPVYALAVGSDLSKTDDLRIERVECPDQVDAKTQFEVNVQVAASGRREFLASLGSLPLALTENGKPVAQQAVQLSTEEYQCATVFRVQAPEAGVHRYHLQLPVFKTEAATLNNERDFVVEVRDPSLRVLYYGFELNQEYKPLRNALKGDPGIDFAGLVRVGPDRFLLQGNRAEDKIENSFPSSLETLQKFKCVIIGGCGAEALSPAALKALDEFVTNGGALVFTGGPHSCGLGGWAQSPLAAAFPWQIAASEPPFRNEETAVELTPMGRAHPVFRGLTGIGGDNARLSKLEGFNTPGPLRPGAEGLLLATPASGERPMLVAIHHYGKGKVLGIASNTLWKWSTAGGEGEKTYNAFWRQALRYLTSSKEDGSLLKLSSDNQGHYRAPARALITARVLDRGLQPLAGANLTATLKRIDGSAIGPVVFHEDATAGSYSAQVDLTAAGDYRLQVGASDNKGLLETREILLQAGGAIGEGSHLAANLDYLEELAQKSGGVVRKQDQARELADAILGGVKTQTKHQEISLLFDSPLYFFVFLGLMAAEWVIRRRMNLI